MRSILQGQAKAAAAVVAISLILQLEKKSPQSRNTFTALVRGSVAGR